MMLMVGESTTTPPALVALATNVCAPGVVGVQRNVAVNVACGEVVCGMVLSAPLTHSSIRVMPVESVALA